MKSKKPIRTIRQRTVRRRPIPKREPEILPQVSPIPTYGKSDKPKIALVQPASYGDNINSTLMLKPLKDHYGDCIIDVHTSTKYGGVFANNPYINKLVYHAAVTKQEALHLNHVIPNKIKGSNYTEILIPHPMINPGCWNSSWNPGLGENLILAWVHALEKLGVKYELPLETIINLNDEEVRKVENYVSHVPMMKERRNVLMEIHGESGQTFWNENWTLGVGEYLMDGKTNLFISHFEQRADIVKLQDKYRGQVHWVGKLSLRECAGLFNHCDAFFSVSSGLSNACNTKMCRNDVKWFEVVNSLTCSSAPIRSEGKVFWHEDNIAKFKLMLSKNL